MHTLRLMLACAALWAAEGVQGQTGGLNDTGQTSCYDASHAAVACDAATTGNSGTRPHQDGRYGRDAALTAGVLPAKIGAGAAGFDYTKIANNGTVLLANATLGAGPADWACTRDNVSGLMWEVKTTSGLRSTSHTYTWYSTANNGGKAGSIGSDTCGGTLAVSPYNGECNTAHYVAAVNAVGLCGASDWRLPTRRELEDIVHFGLASGWVVDADYFPATQADWYWVAETYVPIPDAAWNVDFRQGNAYAVFKSSNAYGRLVRGSP